VDRGTKQMSSQTKLGIQLNRCVKAGIVAYAWEWWRNIL
jgi:hypothetical protein